MNSTNHQSIWIADDDQSIRWVLEKALGTAGYAVRSFEDGAEVMAALESEQPVVLITDLRMPRKDGVSLLNAMQQRFPEIPIVVMTAYSDLDTAVSAFDAGAYEYLPKPFDTDEVVTVVSRACDRQDGRNGGPEPAPQHAGMVGESPEMMRVFRTIARLSKSELSVLLTGETGTGKELAARALHDHSPRRGGPFVALNTAAIPKDLLESELFGHEKGAFTGAQNQHLGRFEQAHGGTLFLDEIGDMPPELQTRLLRVLAESEFYRVGGRGLIKVDVRVIAATHQDLAAKVEAGTFRADLMHRLNVVRIGLPPLRQRREDVALLARHFLRAAAQEMNLEQKQLSEQACELMRAYDWPGNVRELQNLCRRLTVMAPDDLIRPDDLPAEISGQTTRTSYEWQQSVASWAESQLTQNPGQVMQTAQDELQRVLFEAALKRTQGKRHAASLLLGCGRNTLTRRLKDLGLDNKL